MSWIKSERTPEVIDKEYLVYIPHEGARVVMTYLGGNQWFCPSNGNIIREEGLISHWAELLEEPPAEAHNGSDIDGDSTHERAFFNFWGVHKETYPNQQ